MKTKYENKLLILWVNYLAIIVLLIITSCQTTLNGDLENIEEEIALYSLNNNSGQLNSRIHMVNRTATIKPYVSALSTTDKNSNVNGSQEKYYWEFVAEVDPLELGGVRLSATHIALSDNKAYVSYHKQGNLHKGALEILDLSNPNFPSIISQAYFPNSDINAITSDDNGSEVSRKVWLAMSNANQGAQLIEIESTFGQLTENNRKVNISNLMNDSGVSASANGIAATDDYLFVTSGKTFGGTVMIDKTTLESIIAENYPDSKYVAINGKGNNAQVVSLITGDQALLKVGRANQNYASVSYPVGPIYHQNVLETYRGKSTMEFSVLNNNHLYVAKGKYGIGKINTANGKVIAESTPSMLDKGNTNSVSNDEDYVYAANGGDGISISPHPKNGELIEPVFYWDLAEEDASANFIVADGEWLFVAKGEGGFKILRKRRKDDYKTITTYNENGKPDGLEDDKVVCSSLLTNIYANVLPERQDAMIAHPEYFLNPVKNLVIQEETELYMTFIDEGAGFKNVLGYYTYEDGMVPSSDELLDKIVIFPNASAEGSGGELVKGNTMRLLGKFKPGTVVGFFLIANGWKNGKITDGLYSQHTNVNYNQSGKQQSLIFYDATCNSTVIGFEDILVPNGDNDFNDAIFEITASNPSALDYSSFIQINN